MYQRLDRGACGPSPASRNSKSTNGPVKISSPRKSRTSRTSLLPLKRITVVRRSSERYVGGAPSIQVARATVSCSNDLIHDVTESKPYWSQQQGTNSITSSQPNPISQQEQESEKCNTASKNRPSRSSLAAQAKLAAATVIDDRPTQDAQ
jgi:hypothetical protein